MRFGVPRRLGVALVVPVSLFAALRFAATGPPKKSANWQFVGFRGTVGGAGAAARAAETDGPGGELWGGGELGPGLYVTTSRSAAWLYGAAQAQHFGQGSVALWGVDADAAADWVEPTPVPTTSQYDKYPAALSEPPHDVLVNAAECKYSSPTGLPTQYKVNPHRSAQLRLRKLREADVESAFQLADSSPDDTLSPTDDTAIPSVLPIVPVAPDGQCFYAAVAFHVKLSATQRADVWRQVRRGLSLWRSPFGVAPDEKQRVHEVRREIASWIVKEALRSDGNISHGGKQFLQRWALLHPEPRDSRVTPQQMVKAISDTRTAPPISWGDPQLLWPAVRSLYGRQLIVHSLSTEGGTAKKGARWGAVFGTEAEFSPKDCPIEVVFDPSKQHYDACYWRGPFRSE